MLIISFLKIIILHACAYFDTALFPKISTQLKDDNFLLLLQKISSENQLADFDNEESIFEKKCLKCALNTSCRENKGLINLFLKAPCY